MDGSSRSLIEIANNEVSIYEVLQKCGVRALEYAGTNTKLYCPFGDITHLDGGRSRALKVYQETNTAFCFACSERYTPVKLWAEFKDVTLETSADLLLEETDYKPKSYEDKWEELTQEESFNVEALRKSLDLACKRRDKFFEINVTESPLREKYQKCLRALALVDDTEKSEIWLKWSKSEMFKLLP